METNSALDMLKIINEIIPLSVEEYILNIYGKAFLKEFELVFLVFYKLEDAMQDDLARYNKCRLELCYYESSDSIILNLISTT